MFILPDADFADDAEERRSFIVLKENKSAFLCVICARLRPVNTSKHTDKSSFIVSNLANSEAITGKHRSSIACYGCILSMSQLSSFYVTVGFLLFHGCNMNSG